MGSSHARRAHPTGYKSSTRNADIWQQWFLDYGRAHGFADASAVDQRIQEKVRQYRATSCPKVFVSDVSVSRGTLDGQPSVRVSTGVWHHVPYHKWRAPNVIESFARLGAEKSVAWRRQASHRRKMEGDPKRWATPTMKIPIDRTVRALAHDLQGLLGCHVHALVMDAQWYVGGPRAAMPGSNRIFRFNKAEWFQTTWKACHASFWLGSPKILVDARMPFLRLAKKGHRNYCRFVVAVANMYVGPEGFLKGVRIEIKGRMGSRRRSSRHTYIAGWGDSLVADARTVRSYWRDTPSRRGTIRMRVTYFYASSVVDQEDNVQALSHWLGDLKSYSTEEEAGSWAGWCLKLSALLQSWEEERRLPPPAGHWGFEIETLSQHLDLFRTRGMDRLGFWKKHLEYPSYRYEAGRRSWMVGDLKFQNTEQLSKSLQFTRRMEEFSTQLPALLDHGLPAALGRRSRSSTDYWAEDPLNFVSPPSAGSIPIMYGFRGMGRFQRNQLYSWKRRRRKLKVRFGLDIWNFMEAIEREMEKELQKRTKTQEHTDALLGIRRSKHAFKGRRRRRRRFKQARLGLRTRRRHPRRYGRARARFRQRQRQLGRVRRFSIRTRRHGIPWQNRRRRFGRGRFRRRRRRLHRRPADGLRKRRLVRSRCPSRRTRSLTSTPTGRLSLLRPGRRLARRARRLYGRHRFWRPRWSNLRPRRGGRGSRIRRRGRQGLRLRFSGFHPHTVGRKGRRRGGVRRRPRVRRRVRGGKTRNRTQVRRRRARASSRKRSLARFLRRLNRHLGRPSSTWSPKPWVPFQMVPTPWLFSHLEDLHMKRQYWKTKKHERRTRRERWRFYDRDKKKKPWMRRNRYEWRVRKDFFMAWLESQGVRQWSKDPVRMYRARVDTKTHAVLKYYDRAHIKPKRPRTKRTVQPSRWRTRALSLSCMRSDAQRAYAYKPIPESLAKQNLRKGQLVVVHRTPSGPTRGSLPRPRVQGFRTRVRKFLRSELNLAV